MPTKKQLSQRWEGEFEFPFTRHEDDPLHRNESPNSLINMSKYSNLGTGKIIGYDGRRWMVEEYNPDLCGGGYFASPIYESENGLEVRPAGGNWCYKANGAIEITVDDVLKRQIYQSWLNHLIWTRNFIGKFKADKVDELESQITYFNNLMSLIS